MSYDPGQQQVWSSSQPSPYGESYDDGEKFRNADKIALIALAISVMTVVSCIPFVNCIVPLVPLVIGIMALLQSKNAVNMSRAKTYGWIATGIGALYLIGVLIIILLYGTAIIGAIQQQM